MTEKPDRISCRKPTPGKQPTNIPRWKFDLLRKHLLAMVPDQPTGIRTSQLPAMIRTRLSPKELESLGSVNWHVTTVKLELEVRGEIERIKGVSPQRLMRKVKAPPSPRPKAEP
jgi:hypothetical protein